jgi:hypothetical protein
MQVEVEAKSPPPHIQSESAGASITVQYPDDESYALEE